MFHAKALEHVHSIILPVLISSNLSMERMKKIVATYLVLDRQHDNQFTHVVGTWSDTNGNILITKNDLFLLF